MLDLRGQTCWSQPQHREPGLHSPAAVGAVRRHPKADVMELHKRLSGFTRAVMLAGGKQMGKLRDHAVKILPMQSARGLQFRIVILLWTDLLPSPFKGRGEGIVRSLLYVAMTRAEELLVVLHSGCSKYVEEIYRSSGTLPPSGCDLTHLVAREATNSAAPRMPEVKEADPDARDW